MWAMDLATSLSLVLNLLWNISVRMDPATFFYSQEESQGPRLAVYITLVILMLQTKLVVLVCLFFNILEQSFSRSGFVITRWNRGEPPLVYLALSRCPCDPVQCFSVGLGLPFPTREAGKVQDLSASSLHPLSPVPQGQVVPTWLPEISWSFLWNMRSGLLLELLSAGYFTFFFFPSKENAF